MTQRSENEDDDIALTGEYALHLMTASQRRAFDARLDREPALRALLRDWDERLAHMTDEIAPVAPPKLVKQRIEQELFSAAKPQSPRWFGLFSTGRMAMVALFLTVMIVGSIFLTAAPPTTHQVRIAAADQSMLVTVTYQSDSRTLIATRQLGTATSGRSLELWLIADGGVQPVSLGLLTAETDTTFVVAAGLAPHVDNSTLAISDEPAGGSPTGLPTGPVLATGVVTKL